jgi:hypothetical protein
MGLKRNLKFYISPGGPPKRRSRPEERLHAPQVQLPHQLPDDIVDGEDREVALKPLPPPG